MSNADGINEGINVAKLVKWVSIVGNTASKGPFIGESEAVICHTTTNAIAIHASEKMPGPLFLETLDVSFTKIMI